jgi:hypothetical protein
MSKPASPIHVTQSSSGAWLAVVVKAPGQFHVHSRGPRSKYRSMHSHRLRRAASRSHTRNGGFVHGCSIDATNRPRPRSTAQTLRSTSSGRGMS